MSQKSSLPQPAESVSRVLTADTEHLHPTHTPEQIMARIDGAHPIPRRRTRVGSPDGGSRALCAMAARPKYQIHRRASLSPSRQHLHVIAGGENLSPLITFFGRPNIRGVNFF